MRVLRAVSTASIVFVADTLVGSAVTQSLPNQLPPGVWAAAAAMALLASFLAFDGQSITGAVAGIGIFCLLLVGQRLGRPFPWTAAGTFVMALSIVIGLWSLRSHHKALVICAVLLVLVATGFWLLILLVPLGVFVGIKASDAAQTLVRTLIEPFVGFRGAAPLLAFGAGYMAIVVVFALAYNVVALSEPKSAFSWSPPRSDPPTFIDWLFYSTQLMTSGEAEFSAASARAKLVVACHLLVSPFWLVVYFSLLMSKLQHTVSKK